MRSTWSWCVPVLNSLVFHRSFHFLIIVYFIVHVGHLNFIIWMANYLYMWWRSQKLKTNFISGRLPYSILCHLPISSPPIKGLWGNAHFDNLLEVLFVYVCFFFKGKCIRLLLMKILRVVGLEFPIVKLAWVCDMFQDLIYSWICTVHWIGGHDPSGIKFGNMWLTHQSFLKEFEMLKNM